MENSKLFFCEPFPNPYLDIKRKGGKWQLEHVNLGITSHVSSVTGWAMSTLKGLKDEAQSQNSIGLGMADLLTKELKWKQGQRWKRKI